MTTALNSRPALLLVHGAWHRPSSWNRFQDALARRGYQAETIALPSAGLEPVPTAGMYDDAAVIRAKLKQMDGQVVVLAHSYGGVPLTQGAAGATNVSRLIYLSAYMLDRDESMFTFHGARIPAQTSGVLPLIDDPGTSLYGDVPDEDIADAIGQLVNQSMRSFVDNVTEVAWREIPSAYILCEKDQAVAMDLQEISAARATEVFRLATSHSPFLSAPAQLADLVDRIITCSPGSPDGRPMAESSQPAPILA
jgi:pimeloyl-ACP methyl ester carboxylesterase